MDNTLNKIRKSFLKRQDAIESYDARKKAFFNSKEQIIKEIKEAKRIWTETKCRLPKTEFE
jgi:hypothetical protein